MKLICSFGIMILILNTLQAQDKYSIQLIDDQNMAVKAEEVREIKVSILNEQGTQVIYSESFMPTTIVFGILNIELGAGVNNQAYNNAVNSYFSTLASPLHSINARIEIFLNNGKTIQFDDEVKLTNPFPINKVDGNYQSHFSAREMFMEIDTSDLPLGAHVDPSGMNIFGDNRTAQFSSDGISMIKEEDYAKFLLNSGVDLQNSEYKSVYGLNGGQIQNLLNADYFKFSDEELSLGSGIKSSWFLNHNGGGFNPNSTISHTFNTNSYGIIDNGSKRESRIFYNGMTGYFDNQAKFNLGVTTSGSPVLQFLSPAGKLLYNMSPNTEGVVDITTNNPDGQIIFRSTVLNGTAGKNPYVYITQNGGAPGAGMYYNSNNVPVLFASVKNFRMDHPNLADQDIVYASLEGPEAAAYCRGKGQLTQGKQFILFPDHFKFVCSPDDLTIQLTPRSAKSRGLAVTEITKEGFRIEELMEGSGNYEFFWEVKGIRKGFEDYQVIRPKSEVMPVPFKKQVTKE